MMAEMVQFCVNIAPRLVSVIQQKTGFNCLSIARAITRVRDIKT